MLRSPIIKYLYAGNFTPQRGPYKTLTSQDLSHFQSFLKPSNIITD